MRPLLYLIVITSLIGCGTSVNSHSEAVSDQPVKVRPLAIDYDKFFERDGIPYLYGGEDSLSHFNLSNCILKPEQFHYGLGREVFPALLEPRFISVTAADQLWSDSARFLLAKAGNDCKAYSIKDLIRHEVVNDSLDGQPIMAAYCILADLGAIYNRQYGTKTLTFALSGYTYFDPEIWNGLDGFVLWDRETESLWWPLIDRAVSGPLNGVKLHLLDETLWTDTTWLYIKTNYPEAQVMASGLDYERPTSWPKYESVEEIRNYTPNR